MLLHFYKCISIQVGTLLFRRAFIAQPEISVFALPFYSKAPRPLLKLFEFGLNLVMIIKRYIILISDLLRTKSKTIAMAMQVAIKKFTYIHIEKLQFFLGYQRHCDDKLAYHPCSSHLKHFDNRELGDHIVGSFDEYDNIL